MQRLLSIIPDLFRAPSRDWRAAMPAAGRLFGDWYLQTDTKLLKLWNGSAWVTVLDGSGGGGLQDLQQVMSTGPGFGLSNQQLQIQNNIIQILVASSTQAIALKSNELDVNGTNFNLESIDAINFPDRPGAAMQAEKTSAYGACMILYYNSGI